MNRHGHAVMHAIVAHVPWVAAHANRPHLIQAAPPNMRSCDPFTSTRVTAHTSHTCMQHVHGHTSFKSPPKPTIALAGVPQLLPLSHLTSLSARSLEPHPSDAPWLATATWGSLQKLGMGAFRPSLTSLQCLPLGGLTHPYPLSRYIVRGDGAADQICVFL